MVEVTTSAEATVLATGGGESTKFAVLHDGSCDPVDAGVVTDGGVEGINKDDLVVLVGGVLSNPVRVKDTETAALATNSLFGDGADVALELESDTLAGGLSANDSTAGGSLTSSTTNARSVDDVSLLGLVSELAGLLGTARAGETDDAGELSVLPCADAKQEAHHIGLLLLPELLQVFVGTCSTTRFLFPTVSITQQQQHVNVNVNVVNARRPRGATRRTKRKRE